MLHKWSYLLLEPILFLQLSGNKTISLWSIALSICRHLTSNVCGIDEQPAFASWADILQIIFISLLTVNTTSVNLQTQEFIYVMTRNILTPAALSAVWS